MDRAKTLLRILTVHYNFNLKSLHSRASSRAGVITGRYKDAIEDAAAWKRTDNVEALSSGADEAKSTARYKDFS
jgi:hypothetical protein